MKRRYGFLALAVLALLLLHLGWQEAPERPALTSQSARPAAESPQTQPPLAPVTGPIATTAAPASPAQTPASWRDLPDEMNRKLASVVCVSEQPLDTELGQFTLVTYRDGVENTAHMALTLGKVCAEEPTLVRVHNMEPLRDLFLVKQPGRWSLRAAMAEVAKAGSGVVLLLGNPLTGPELLAHLGGKQPAPSPATYSTVGAGSQILRDLGVRKMRLMSAPMKFNAISGFDLEVVEYLPAE